MTVSDVQTSVGGESAALSVGGMDCASCVAHVEKAARRVAGVEACQVNLARGRAAIRFDPQQTTAHRVAEAITAAGYPAEPEAPDAVAGEAEEHRVREQAEHARGWFRRAVAGAILWLPLELAHGLLRLLGHHHAHPAQATAMGWVTLGLSTIAMVYVGSRFYRSAFGALRRGSSNMDTLIAMGASVAYGYSLVYFLGGLLGWWAPPAEDELYFMEASGLLALISLGHWLEARARQSAGSAIRELLQLAPSVALLIEAPAAGATPADKTREVPVSQLKPDDRVLVRPGDRVPADGVVVEGRSAVDEAMITGEPLPVTRGSGDAVIGGTINLDGRLVVRVTRVAAESALAQIVALVENAQSSKPPVQQLADRIAAVFVPSVLLIALITAIGWYAWGAGHGWSAAHIASASAKAVCSVLIIACPCALGLAVPTAVMVGTGLGARRGILIRDIDALQNAEGIDTVVLDKTGTVTEGKPVVRDVVSLNGMPAEQVLRLAAAAEQFSSHPLAQAVVRHTRERGISIPQPASFQSEAGRGVWAEVEGSAVLVGSEEFLTMQPGAPASGDRGGKPAVGLDPEHPSSLPAGMTSVWVGRKTEDGAIERLGAILLSDRIKPDSAAAVAELHAMGLRTVLLTGDEPGAAEAVAREAGIDDVRARVKPAEKAAVIRALQEGAGRASRVAMVGDGINDAAALAQANLGIALGGGSDVAKEAGDIVLVSGSLRGVAASIRLSRATMRKIRQNLFLAFIYNVLAIPLAAMGLLHPLIAAAAMALSDVTVIGNALLLRHSRAAADAPISDLTRRHPPV